MRRRLGALVAVVVVASFVVATSGRATVTFTFTRFAGADRYATASDVATRTFITSDSVVLTTGERFPDALAGNYVAGGGPRPILLTTRDALPQPTATALTTMRVTKVTILGGTDAVSSGVEAALQQSGYTTTRIGGADRYETARLAAESRGAAAVGTVGGQRTAIVASGENYPDALSAGPISFAGALPIILTTRASLAPAAKAAIADLGIARVVIAGGTAAVSTAAEDEIRAMGGKTVVRVAGIDRTDTAARLADWAIANVGASRTHINLARGNDFADALAGGPHAGQDGPAAILLSQTESSLGPSARAWLQAHSDTLLNGHIYGGTDAVSSDVENDAQTAARSPSTSTTNPPTPSPHFRNVSARAGETTMTLVYDEAVVCTSVDTGDYLVQLTGGPQAGSFAPTAVDCAAPASDHVVISVPAERTWQTAQEGTVVARAGTDGDTVKDALGREQPVGNSVNFQVP